MAVLACNHGPTSTPLHACGARGQEEVPEEAGRPWGGGGTGDEGNVEEAGREHETDPQGLKPTLLLFH